MIARNVVAAKAVRGSIGDKKGSLFQPFAKGSQEKTVAALIRQLTQKNPSVTAALEEEEEEPYVGLWERLIERTRIPALIRRRTPLRTGRDVYSPCPCSVTRQWPPTPLALVMRLPHSHLWPSVHAPVADPSLPTAADSKSATRSTIFTLRRLCQRRRSMLLSLRGGGSS